jgi:hypothetical protein
MSNNAGSGGQPPASTSTGTLKEVKDDIRPVSTASHTTDNDDDLPVTKPIISRNYTREGMENDPAAGHWGETDGSEAVDVDSALNEYEE